MRSPKSRSRGKSNRNRSSGNNINRVFDSSGPEGKVRGTPQQVIDKYHLLTRDAQLANDRVAAENFLQHAEHYARLLGEARREAEARKAEMETLQRERQTQRDTGRSGREEVPAFDNFETERPGTAGTMGISGEAGGSGLVETPEGAARPRRGGTPRAAKPPESNGGANAPQPSEAAK